MTLSNSNSQAEDLRQRPYGPQSLLKARVFCKTVLATIVDPDCCFHGSVGSSRAQTPRRASCSLVRNGLRSRDVSTPGEASGVSSRDGPPRPGAASIVPRGLSKYSLLCVLELAKIGRPRDCVHPSCLGFHSLQTAKPVPGLFPDGLILLISLYCWTLFAVPAAKPWLSLCRSHFAVAGTRCLTP